jgi:hypothetical protein
MSQILIESQVEIIENKDKEIENLKKNDKIFNE